jgi:hypothetical protein
MKARINGQKIEFDRIMLHPDMLDMKALMKLNEYPIKIGSTKSIPVGQIDLWNDGKFIAYYLIGDVRRIYWKKNQ